MPIDGFLPEEGAEKVQICFRPLHIRAKRQMFPTWEWRTPKLGTPASQYRMVSFPRWEHGVHEFLVEVDFIQNTGWSQKATLFANPQTQLRHIRSRLCQKHSKKPCR